MSTGPTPIEVKRWREGDDLLWQYLGFTARLTHLAPPNTDPAEVLAGLEEQ